MAQLKRFGMSRQDDFYDIMMAFQSITEFCICTACFPRFKAMLNDPWSGLRPTGKQWCCLAGIGATGCYYAFNGIMGLVSPSVGEVSLGARSAEAGRGGRLRVERFSGARSAGLTMMSLAGSVFLRQYLRHMVAEHRRCRCRLRPAAAAAPLCAVAGQDVPGLQVGAGTGAADVDLDQHHHPGAGHDAGQPPASAGAGAVQAGVSSGGRFRKACCAWGGKEALYCDTRSQIN